MRADALQFKTGRQRTRGGTTCRNLSENPFPKQKGHHIELGSLARTLDELAIEPFRMEDVNRYKEERARTVEQQVFGEYEQRARCSGDRELPPGTYVRAIWHRVPLRGYNSEVPGFALSHAMEIKERMPTADFEIEELRVDKRYDPFLVVSCRRERFYIEVWDERGFETQHS